MKNLWKWVSQELKKTSQTAEEQYLSEATSLADLERRQRDVAFGKAPFQRIAQLNAGIFKKENSF